MFVLCRPKSSSFTRASTLSHSTTTSWARPFSSKPDTTLNGQYSPNCVPASSPSGTQIPEALAFSNSELSRKEALREYHRQYRQKNKEALADRQHRYYLLHKETIKQGQRERRAQTKEATRERNKQYYLENKEARKEFQKKYRAQNKETLQRRKKEYYQTHKTAIALFQHVYRTKNKDSAKVKQKKYRTENKEAIRKIQQRYRKENEVLREYQRRYRREKREAIRELHKRYHAKHRLLNPRIRKNWQNPENVRNFFESVAPRLGVTSTEDWYRVSLKQITRVGGGTICYKFRNIGKALAYAYPEAKWEISRFSKFKKKSGQRWLHMTLKDIFEEETEIAEDFLHPHLLWEERPTTVRDDLRKTTDGVVG